MKKIIINLITALAFIAAIYVLTQLYGCAVHKNITDYDNKQIVVPDYTQFQAYPVTVIKKPGSITIYNSRPTLTLPYTQIKVAPPPVTIYIY